MKDFIKKHPIFSTILMYAGLKTAVKEIKERLLKQIQVTVVVIKDDANTEGKIVKNESSMKN